MSKKKLKKERRKIAAKKIRNFTKNQIKKSLNKIPHKVKVKIAEMQNNPKLSINKY